jgi:hypothetical protein
MAVPVAPRWAPPPRLITLVARSGGCLSHLYLFRSGQLRRSEIERDIGDLSVEPKRHLIIQVIHSRTCVDSDIEALITWQQERNCLRDLQGSYFFAVDCQYARASLRNAGAVILEVKDDLVLAGRDRIVARAHRACRSASML